MVASRRRSPIVTVDPGGRGIEFATGAMSTSLAPSTANRALTRAAVSVSRSALRAWWTSRGASSCAAPSRTEAVSPVSSSAYRIAPWARRARPRSNGSSSWPTRLSRSDWARSGAPAVVSASAAARRRRRRTAGSGVSATARVQERAAGSPSSSALGPVGCSFELGGHSLVR